MAPISPHLDTLLTRWVTRGNDLRKETAFQKDLIDPVALAANGNRLAMRERRRRDLRQVEQTAEDARTRWEERLHRIEEWKNAVGELRQEETYLQNLIGASLWLEKARTHQDAFIRRLERRAEVLEAGQHAIHDALEAWQTLLMEREASLQDLVQKEVQADRPFYVSRGRKQPEVDFLRDQQATNEIFGRELNALRRSLGLARDRLRKAQQAVEQRASGAEIFYELHKQEILSALKITEQILDQRREQILSDALVYEGGHHVLRRIQTIVNGLRCIEDIPTGKRGWKKRFS